MEYGLIAALICLAALAGMRNVSNAVVFLFSDTNEGLMQAFQ